MRSKRRNDKMELDYALETVLKATYHDAEFFSDDFKGALQAVIRAADRYRTIKKALEESE